MVSRPADNNAAAVLGYPADYPVLRLHRVLDDLRAEIKLLHTLRGVAVDVGYELPVKSALLRRQGGHLLIIERDIQTLADQLAYLLARGAMLPGDGDDNPRVGGLDHCLEFLRLPVVNHIRLLQELTVKQQSHKAGEGIRHRESQPEILKPEP